MKFDIICTMPVDDEGHMRPRKFVYDNLTSELTDEEGKHVYEKPEFSKYVNASNLKAVSRETPVGKKDIKILKIQLGLSCNYSCEYCSQRFVPTAEETSSKHVDKFLENLDSWMKETPKKVEFWGGEPLVYFKTLKPLAEALRIKWPDVKFLMITNGSLLTPEINDWLVEQNFSVGISHDGPGQKVRGPDPLKDPSTRKNIMDLYKKMNGNMSFNAMVHRENMDRYKIAEYFIDNFGLNVRIGEGSFIDSYDEGGMKNSACTHEELLAFRRLTMKYLRKSHLNNFMNTEQRINEWILSLETHRPASVLPQKCGMDKEDNIAVDLRGNVLTCQNVSAVSTKDNGQQHLIGHVSKLDRVKLDTATHWSFRKECVECPMLQGCKGSCMFLDDEKFKRSCDTAYSDHLPYFCAAIEIITGALPFAILAHDKSLPEERADLWGRISHENVKIPEIRE